MGKFIVRWLVARRRGRGRRERRIIGGAHARDVLALVASLSFLSTNCACASERSPLCHMADSSEDILVKGQRRGRERGGGR